MLLLDQCFIRNVEASLAVIKLSRVNGTINTYFYVLIFGLRQSGLKGGAVILAKCL